ncbi:MAG: T9SS type A sorting domain-containing protein [Bacteroidales bacterium]
MKKTRVLVFLIVITMVAFKASGQEMISEDKEAKDAVIYPNPIIGEKFLVKSETAISKIEVVNVIGKVINRTENKNFELKEIQVVIGKCEKGMYFVKITFQDKESIVKKLLVK